MTLYGIPTQKWKVMVAKLRVTEELSTLFNRDKSWRNFFGKMENCINKLIHKEKVNESDLKIMEGILCLWVRAL